MVFIFNDTPGMSAVATGTAGLADETANAGMQGCVAGQTVMPPGLDLVSAANVAKIKALTTECAAHLATAAGHQLNYGESVAGAATGYSQTDMLGAAGIAAVGVNTAGLSG